MSYISRRPSGRVQFITITEKKTVMLSLTDNITVKKYYFIKILLTIIFNLIYVVIINEIIIKTH